MCTAIYRIYTRAGCDVGCHNCGQRTLPGFPYRTPHHSGACEYRLRVALLETRAQGYSPDVPDWLGSQERVDAGGIRGV